MDRTRIEVMAHGLIVTGCLLIALAVWMALSAFTSVHPTELYIPIGQSPGLSLEGKTVIGVLGDVDFTHRKVVIGCTEVQLTKDTPIYLDRSMIQQTNTVGDWGDLVLDMVVEAYQDQWIKVRRE